MKKALFLCLLLIPAFVTSSYAIGKPGMVKELIDADTMKIAVEGKTIRIQLVGIKVQGAINEDAAKNTAFGKTTFKYVKKHIKKNTPVLVEFEGDATAGEGGDRLANVSVMLTEKDEDGKPQILHLNNALIKGGWSPYYTEHGRSKRFDIAFRRAEAHARDNKLGIWGSPEDAKALEGKRLEWDRKAVEKDAARAPMHGNLNDDGIERGVRRDLDDKKVPMAAGRLMMMRREPVTYPYVSTEKMKEFHTNECEIAKQIHNKDVKRYVDRHRALIDKKVPCGICNP